MQNDEHEIPMKNEKGGIFDGGGDTVSAGNEERLNAVGGREKTKNFYGVISSFGFVDHQTPTISTLVTSKHCYDTRYTYYFIW